MFGFCFLAAQTLITYGVVKERSKKECVGAVEIMNWEKSLKLAKEICVDGRGEIKQIYEERIKQAEDEAKKWKINYNWLYNRVASTTKEFN